MRIRARRVGVVLGLVCLLAASAVVHAAVMTQRFVGLAGVLIALQAGWLGWLLLPLSRPMAALRLAVAALLFAATWWIWQQAQDGLVMAAAVPHAVINLGLLSVFASSLAPGRDAIITRVARRARGQLTPDLLAYTRRVTLAWCLYFAAQLLASVLLWHLAPRAWWSLFVTLGTFPSLVLMFGAELAYRHWRHGIHRPAGDANAWRAALAQFRMSVRP